MSVSGASRSSKNPQPSREEEAHRFAEIRQEFEKTLNNMASYQPSPALYLNLHFYPFFPGDFSFNTFKQALGLTEDKPEVHKVAKSYVLQSMPADYRPLFEALKKKCKERFPDFKYKKRLFTKLVHKVMPSKAKFKP